MKQKKIKSTLFDVLAIVFSIMISFYIQEKLNDFEKEQLKNETLAGVQNDLKTDKAFFLMTLDFLYQRVQFAQNIQNGIISQEGINSLLLTWDFGGQNPNFKSLISTGALEYIENKSLSSELNYYYENAYGVLARIGDMYVNLFYKFSDYMMLHYPIESMPEISREKKNNFYFAPYRFNPNVLTSALDDFRFKNYVFDMKRIIYANIKFYEEAIVRIEKLEELIKVELSL